MIPQHIIFPMEENKFLQGNLSNQINISNPPINQHNIVQYNIFPQAINSFNSGNQSFAPYGMNSANNVNNYNGQIIHKENIMNQYGQNKNNINTNYGAQNLSINNDRNTDGKNISLPLGLGEDTLSKKKVQFECPKCHEEYSREEFFSGRKKIIFGSEVCSSCEKHIREGEFYFMCKICKLFFCDDCTLEK